MPGMLNYAAFATYGRSFTKFKDDFDNFLMNFAYTEGHELIELIQSRTPVDTGRLKANWEMTDVSTIKRTIYLEIENPVYYASWVEYGHAKPYKAGALPGSPDWVEGRFMYTRSVTEFDKGIKQRFDEALSRFCLSKGVIR